MWQAIIRTNDGLIYWCIYVTWPQQLNSCHVEFILGNTKMYLHFIIFQQMDRAGAGKQD